MNTKPLICAAIVGAAIAGAANAAAKDPTALAPPGPRFEIQAHRGAGIKKPENTLESFEYAWSIGVTPECDLRTTADDVIVCFHDEDFSRIVSGLDESRKSLGVERLPHSEVQKLDVGAFRGNEFAGQHVPTLARVFKAMQGHPERLLYLDIKTELVDLDALEKLVKKYDVGPQIIFTTKFHDLIRSWKRRMPDSLTLLWNGGTEDELKKKLAKVRAADFEGVTHLQIHVKVVDGLDSREPFMPSITFLQDVGKELKARGIVFQALPWECDDQAVFVKLLELGVESFATDYPETTLAAVREYRSRAGER